ncbi:MAG: hypothetical protein KatS3mg015_1055 [Fimbriimonadales bacterium]|nr:MAG: hypothetical protein KatS3mg015_1055 [Fimbriimonadales bacterium]
MRGAIGAIAIIHSLFAVMFWFGMGMSTPAPAYLVEPYLVPADVIGLSSIALGVIVTVLAWHPLGRSLGAVWAGAGVNALYVVLCLLGPWWTTLPMFFILPAVNGLLFLLLTQRDRWK